MKHIKIKYEKIKDVMQTIDIQDELNVRYREACQIMKRELPYFNMGKSNRMYVMRKDFNKWKEKRDERAI